MTAGDVNYQELTLAHTHLPSQPHYNITQWTILLFELKTVIILVIITTKDHEHSFHA